MSRASAALFLGFVGWVVAPQPIAGEPAANDSRMIAAVAPEPSTMNPTLGDSVRVSITMRAAGSIDLDVIDRDGYVVRSLARDAGVTAGTNLFTWDGRDADGIVVPDEAYSFRVHWSDGRKHERYFPGDEPTHMIAVQADYYSARTATLAYTLAAPSRVHVQAGTVVKNPKTGEMEGPVLKTIVNREPRAAGRIAEPWNGLDESGAIHVADLPNFVVSIAATPLPQGSVMTYGNRARTFAEAVVTRTGESLFTKRTPHAHHAGLGALDDTSPKMELRPLNGAWSEQERAWRVVGSTLRVRVSLTGPSAPHFVKQPGQIYRFVDGRLHSITKRIAKNPVEIEIPLRDVDGLQLVALNWRSEYGGVAANAVHVIHSGAQR